MRGKTCNDFNTNAGIYAMELLPCAAKPVAVAISQGCNTSAANCAAAAMRGKTCGLRNTSAGNYATAVIRGKPLVAAKQARENL